MEKIYTAKTPEEKAEQRALLQYFLPKNQKIVLSALKRCGRQDLIGNSKNCLVQDLNNSIKPTTQKKKSVIRNKHKKKH